MPSCFALWTAPGADSLRVVTSHDQKVLQGRGDDDYKNLQYKHIVKEHRDPWVSKSCNPIEVDILAYIS